MNIVFNNQHTINNLALVVKRQEKLHGNKEIGGLIIGKYSFWKNTLYIDSIDTKTITLNFPQDLFIGKKNTIGHWHNHPSGNMDPSYVDEMTMTANAVNKKIPFLLIVTNTNKGTQFSFYKYTLFKQRLVKKLYLHNAISGRNILK